jgi:hypothetical protein
MLREHEVDLSDPATHNTLDPHQPFTVEVGINVAASLALILVTTLHWHRNAVRSLATHASVWMHDTTHGLIFGGAQVWALGTVDVQHHGHRIALSIVNKAGGDANWYTKLLNKLKDCVNHVARHMHGTAAVLYANCMPPKEEWVTGFMDVHEDPCAAENEWLGHNSEIIDDFWKWANWYHVNHAARGLRGRLNRTAKRSQQAADLPQMLLLQEHSVQVSAPSQQYVCSHRHTLT